MTDGPPEDELAEEVVHDEGADPEEYDADGDNAQSRDTGTVYEGTEGDREPAETPHDTTDDDEGTDGEDG
jgi:hypothetical protein